jgi:Single Cache domain 2
VLRGFVVLFAMASVTLVWAQSQSGTPEEAKAMLQKAEEALKKDPAKALEMFTKGDGGFKDRDLYVFCYDTTTSLSSAHGADAKRVGTVNIKEVKDADGKEYGKEMLTVATEGVFKEVAYKFPRPGETTPSPKSTFITKVGNQLCGVGYYK